MVRLFRSVLDVMIEFTRAETRSAKYVPLGLAVPPDVARRTTLRPVMLGGVQAATVIVVDLLAVRPRESVTVAVTVTDPEEVSVAVVPLEPDARLAPELERVVLDRRAVAARRRPDRPLELRLSLHVRQVRIGRERRHRLRHRQRPDRRNDARRRAEPEGDIADADLRAAAVGDEAESAVAGLRVRDLAQKRQARRPRRRVEHARRDRAALRAEEPLHSVMEAGRRAVRVDGHSRVRVEGRAPVHRRADARGIVGSWMPDASDVPPN